MAITAGSFVGSLGAFDLLPLVALGLFWLILLVKIHLKLSKIDKYLAVANADSDVRNISASAQERLAQRHRMRCKPQAEVHNPFSAN